MTDSFEETLEGLVAVRHLDFRFSPSMSIPVAKILSCLEGLPMNARFEFRFNEEYMIDEPVLVWPADMTDFYEI